MNTYMSEILNMLQDNHAEANLLNIYDINPSDPLDNISGYEKLENYFFHKYINYIQSTIKNKIYTYDFSYQHDTGYIFNITLFRWVDCSGDAINGKGERKISLYPYFGFNKMNFSSKDLVFIPDRYKDRDGNITENHLQNRIVSFLEKIGFKVKVTQNYPFNLILKIIIPDDFLKEINWHETLRKIREYKKNENV